MRIPAMKGEQRLRGANVVPPSFSMLRPEILCVECDLLRSDGRRRRNLYPQILICPQGPFLTPARHKPPGHDSQRPACSAWLADIPVKDAPKTPVPLRKKFVEVVHVLKVGDAVLKGRGSAVVKVGTGKVILKRAFESVCVILHIFYFTLFADTAQEAGRFRRISICQRPRNKKNSDYPLREERNISSSTLRCHQHLQLNALRNSSR